MEQPTGGDYPGADKTRDAENHATSAHRKDPSISSAASSHRRSGSGAALFSKLSFMRPTTSEAKSRLEGDGEKGHSHSSSRAMGTVVQQQKSRRRTGSLRKVALMGRGAQRERRDAKQLTIDTTHAASHRPEEASPAQDVPPEHPTSGLRISNATVRQYSLGELANRTSEPHVQKPSRSSSKAPEGELNVASPTRSTNSTTDEDDLPQISNRSVATSRPESDPSLSSGSESYFGSRAGEQPLRRRSPLAYSGMASTSMPAADSDWDYSDTEWWGWVVLAVTWVVFVVGMGSCLGVWSWAWDVGTTPYAPPELEDDPTLPIVGYYPALIILTCIMAWVWVVVAWVGMKYFRHAKISGD